MHKDLKNPPMRPILSMINAYNHTLASDLNELLTPLIPKRYVLEDTFKFLAAVEDLNKKPEKMRFLASFDVKSLFTNIPVDRTITHILSKIPEDFHLSKETVKSLLELACKNVPFIFNGTSYTQLDGMAMGSPAGVMMAGFALDMVEQELENFQVQPEEHRHYVDDCFDVLEDENLVEPLLTAMNGVIPDIQFTVEKELNRKLNFLDVTIHRSEDNRLQTSWFVKPTNTGLYIPYHSYCDPRYQKSVARCLFYRAHRISSSNEAVVEAFDRIFNMLEENGYPTSLLQRESTRVLAPDSVQNPETATGKPIYWKLPYIDVIHKITQTKIRQISSKLSNSIIVPVFSSWKSKNWFQNKDKVAMSLCSSLVYEFKCQECERSYVGETRRHLSTRIKEHLNPISNTEVSKHCHEASADNFKIVLKHRRTKIAEAIVLYFFPDKNALLNKQGSSYPLSLFI